MLSKKPNPTSTVHRHSCATARPRREGAQKVTERVEGAFYRSDFAAGYNKGYRFVGRLHQDACRSVLDDARRDRATALTLRSD
jgi:hypothetical protein